MKITDHIEHAISSLIADEEYATDILSLVTRVSEKRKRAFSDELDAEVTQRGNKLTIDVGDMCDYPCGFGGIEYDMDTLTYTASILSDTGWVDNHYDSQHTLVSSTPED